MKIKLAVIKTELAALARFNPNVFESAEKEYRSYSGEPEEFEIALIELQKEPVVSWFFL
ncbi:MULTISPECIES: hypothetical protein [Bacillus]|uniref:hypothetical protein n=1 Tax=Bacillus TaxID=1386 RepID=UPI0001A14614|nr:hypothetical protein [Bacillus pseudomycoides]EEM01677.1 hypothetical protein bmyco0002_60200 [Bacillus pseudomycoides]EEM07677.1 hypothetical protein bmyco0003_56590 [Bacillus pseudomycoides]MCR8861162.1 hypothetical protein [Bacillus pseudomycoides]MED1477459.1 hypothetical protein [Bacillus pseudomycoides]MED1534420.1 hypothetical protein [Bacillus pseudomycoides]